MYTRSYAEQSSSSGILLEDVVALHDGGSGVPVIFGCETRETGEIFKQRADGLFGLGNSDASVINQLVAAGEIDDVFSLCFGMVEGDGVLMLGDSPATADIPLQHTPLVPSPTHPFYYNVRLDAISGGGEELEVDSGVFQEGYATVLDSGTTFTYIPTPAFQAFSAAVEAYAVEHGLVRVRGPDPQYDDICFGGAPEHTDVDAMQQVFPTFGLHFAPNATLILGPLNYLFVHTFNSGKYCLGVFDNGHAGTLLGGITFRNVLVQYDRANGRVGFGGAACKDLGHQHRPPCSAFSAGGNDLAAIVAVADGDCEPEPGATVPQGTRIDSSADYADASDLGLEDDDDEHEVVMPSDTSTNVVPQGMSSTGDDIDDDGDQELVNADEMDLGMSGFDYEEQANSEQSENNSSSLDVSSEVDDGSIGEDLSQDGNRDSQEDARGSSSGVSEDNSSRDGDDTTTSDDEGTTSGDNNDGSNNKGPTSGSSNEGDNSPSSGVVHPYTDRADQYPAYRTSTTDSHSTSMNEDGSIQYDESDTNDNYDQGSHSITPLTIGLSVGTIAMLSSALMIALIRPGSREALQSLFPRFRRYQAVPGNDDPESGGGSGPGSGGNTGNGSGNSNNNNSGNNKASAGGGGKGGNNKATAVGGANSLNNGGGSTGGNGAHTSNGVKGVVTISAIGGLLPGGGKNSNNNISGGGGGLSSILTLNPLIGKQAPPAIAVISMTQLSSKTTASAVVGGSTTPRVVGLTTPQKLQRTNSNTTAAAAFAEELASMQGHTPRAGGGAGQSTITLNPHPRAPSRGPSTPTRMQMS